LGERTSDIAAAAAAAAAAMLAWRVCAVDRFPRDTRAGRVGPGNGYAGLRWRHNRDRATRMEEILLRRIIVTPAGKEKKRQSARGQREEARGKRRGSRKWRGHAGVRVLRSFRDRALAGSLIARRTRL